MHYVQRHLLIKKLEISNIQLEILLKRIEYHKTKKKEQPNKNIWFTTLEKQTISNLTLQDFKVPIQL